MTSFAITLLSFGGAASVVLVNAYVQNRRLKP
jgi:hypothetical protein